MSSIFVEFMHKSLQLLFWKDKKEMKKLYDVPLLYLWQRFLIYFVLKVGEIQDIKYFNLVYIYEINAPQNKKEEFSCKKAKSGKKDKESQEKFQEKENEGQEKKEQMLKVYQSQGVSESI